MERIKDRYAYLRTERLRLEARFNTIRRLEREIRSLVPQKFDPEEELFEEWQGGVQTAQELVSELEDFVGNTDRDLTKLKKGITDLESLTRTKGYKPFKEFIETDMDISCHNMAKCIQDFNTTIERFRQMRSILRQY